ncbi:MAG: VOC family protein [Hyphomicrobiales bacterium]|nr:MAG: VOC family protein [Hyphomicrobiales bacterium]
MSRQFGKVRQLGYVVRDLDTALDRWTKDLGVGPFFKIGNVPLSEFSYRGVPSRPDLNIALAYSGDLQIELIQQLNDAESPYRDFLDTSGPGLHHVCAFSTQYDSLLEQLAASGRVPDCTGAISDISRFSYFDVDNTDGTVIEIGDAARSPELGEAFEVMHKASVDWDGSQPIRAMSL